MIIKKPYAFLIKNFRIIHAILFVLIAFLAVKSMDVHDFFTAYLSNHAYTDTANLAAQYINFPMYLATVLVALVSLLIYYILSLKNKDRKIYMYSVIYYLGLIAYFIFMYIVLKNLSGSTFSVEKVRDYRDITLIAFIPQIIFAAIIFVRALGFNIKQFEFKKDLEEMNIDVSDSEEIEVNVGSDSYKIMRTIRKGLRLSKYFILENKLFVIIVSSIFTLIITLSVISGIDVYKEDVAMNQNFIANNLNYVIDDSYITKYDMNNNEINKNINYLLVGVTVKNNTTKKAELTRESFRLLINNEMLFPNMTVSNYFLDLGRVFKTITIEPGYEEKFYLTFEIKDEDLSNDYMLKVYSKIQTSKELGQEYKSVIVKPTNLDKITNNKNMVIPNTVKFDKTILKNTELLLTEYKIEDKFKEDYTYTINNVSKKGTYTIIPDVKNNELNKILRLESTITIDKESEMSKYINNSQDFYKYYTYIEYEYKGKQKTLKIVPKELLYNLDKYTYFEIPNEVLDSQKVDLSLIIRGQKYTFNLK